MVGAIIGDIIGDIIDDIVDPLVDLVVDLVVARSITFNMYSVRPSVAGEAGSKIVVDKLDRGV